MIRKLKNARVCFTFLITIALMIIFYNLMFSSNNWNDVILSKKSIPIAIQCNHIESIKTFNISTIDSYRDLNFKPVYRTYWNDTFDQKYFHRKNNWRNLPLKVFIVPHSHIDPGWLKTFEEYYISHTELILNNMIKKLDQYHDMTFIWAEIAFFARWWQSIKNRNDQKSMDAVKSLYHNRRFEIATGGWVMTDEASAHYYDMIDQLIEGHQFLKSTIGITDAPINGWSIDPFGHGTTLPYLLSKAGIKNTVIQRNHFGWKQFLAERQMHEFIWKQNFQSSDSKQQIYCRSAPFDLYVIKFSCGPDTNICLQFDFRRIQNEMTDSQSVPITNDNVQQMSELILGQYGKLASLFPHNVALVPLGNDFRYEVELEWDQQYKNYQIIIDHINKNRDKFNNTEIAFGTLNDYFTEVHSRMGKLNDNRYPILVGDFMPYADNPEGIPNYWTGYFSTRPFWKSLSRELQHWLRSAEILYTFAHNYARQNKHYKVSQRMDDDYSLLINSRQNLALFQHHDAITGTSKEFVMKDYGERLNNGIVNAIKVITHSIEYFLFQDESILNNNNNNEIISDIQRESWDKLSIKVTLSVEKNLRKIMIFNSLTHERTEPIRIILKSQFVKVVDAENGSELKIQINPLFTITSEMSNEAFEILIFAELPPLSIISYLIEPLNENIDNKAKVENYDTSLSNDIEFESPYFIFKFDGTSGLLKSIHHKKFGITRNAKITFHYHNAEGTYSGAYLFQAHQSKQLLNFDEPKRIIRIIRGEFSSEVNIIYPNFFHLKTRVYHSDATIGSGLEMLLSYDMSNKNELSNKQLVMRIETDINNSDPLDSESVFYVDSNGFQMIKRKYYKKLEMEANYYPMSTAMFIEDDISRVTVVSGQGHGVTCPDNGLMEIMLERKLSYDDYRGLGEGVNDNKLTQMKFWLTLEAITKDEDINSVPNLSLLSHSLLHSLQYPPVLVHSLVHSNGDKSLNSRISFIDGSIDCDLFLVNFRTLPNISDFNRPSISSLLIFHRLGNACKVKPHISLSNLYCKSQMTQFLHVKVQSMNECSITAMKDYGKIKDIRDVNIPVMEIGSFNVTFAQ